MDSGWLWLTKTVSYTLLFGSLNGLVSESQHWCFGGPIGRKMPTHKIRGFLFTWIYVQESSSHPSGTLIVS